MKLQRTTKEMGDFDMTQLCPQVFLAKKDSEYYLFTDYSVGKLCYIGIKINNPEGIKDISLKKLYDNADKFYMTDLKKFRETPKFQLYKKDVTINNLIKQRK